MRQTLLAPAGGALIGLAAVGIAERGTGSRPVLAVVVIALAVAAAVLPLRFGLGIAVVLAGFDGFIVDFVGYGARYWNEVFAALLIARSVVFARPTRRELVVAAAVALVLVGYLASGTSLKADAWGLKVLGLWAVGGYGIYRLRPGLREWLGAYAGLATLTAASLVLEVWQRSKGARGLEKLGLAYGERVRQISPSGSLRAFGGFTSAAPLSYALAIALAAWVGFLLCSPSDRRVAWRTCWLPPVAAIGMYLTVDRTAVLALLAGLIVLAIAYRPAILLPAVALAAVLVGLGALAGIGSPFRHELGSSAKARAALWDEYLADLRPFGRGPATAGSAYKKVAPEPPWVPPIRIPSRWDVTYSQIVARGVEQPVLGTYLPHLPPLVLSADARSLAGGSRFGIASERGKTLLVRDLAAGVSEPIAVRVPASRKAVSRLTIGARPPVSLRNLRFAGLPPTRTPAERIWQRWFDRTPAALQSDGPGLVDNLYVSWLWQYGLIGVVVCAVWLVVLLRPIWVPKTNPVAISAVLVGVFLVVAALAVNIWEEAPIDLLAAIVLAVAYSVGRATPTRAGRSAA